MINQEFSTVMSLSSTALATSYTASSPMQVGRAETVQFYVKNVRSLGSGATTTTLKLQMRYNDGTNTTAYLDLSSEADDTQGAPTLAIEHAFSSTANATTAGTFYLDDARAIVEITVNLKVNATGQAGDNTTVYAVAA